jgi:hypothetical protein
MALQRMRKRGQGGQRSAWERNIYLLELGPKNKLTTTPFFFVLRVVDDLGTRGGFGHDGPMGTPGTYPELAVLWGAGEAWVVRQQCVGVRVCLLGGVGSSACVCVRVARFGFAFFALM